MTEPSASAEEPRWLERFENVRRPLSWLCISLFIGSFIALLGLSATSYWEPGNPWIGFLDHVWRASGLLEIVLWSIPRIARAGEWVAGVFSR